MLGVLSRRRFVARTSTLALASPFLSLVGCDSDETNDLLSFGGSTMGTSYNVKFADISENVDPNVLAREVDAVLQSVNQRMSTYLADSELSQFNAAEPGQWTTLSDHTLKVVRESRRLHTVTGRAFDPTIGPLVDLWGFGPEGGPDQVPTEKDIAATIKTIGFDGVELHSEQPKIRKHASGVGMDFSGVAKGYAVDLVAQHLERSGVDNYLVEVGGELRSNGTSPNGRPWRVGIEKPVPGSRDIQQVVELQGRAMATSGNYRIFFEQNGRRYSHIVDPTTGRPVDHDLASVTVIAPTTLEADALSTAMLVLGPEKGMALAAERDIAAYFIAGSEGSFRETASTAFSDRIEV